MTMIILRRTAASFIGTRFFFVEATMGGQAHATSSDRPQARDSHAQCRCQCGNLLAKIVTSGIELKCRRCKRVEVIAFGDVQGWEQRTPSPL